MKNKKIKKVAITLTAFLIVGGNIIPSMTAFASENNVKIEDTVTQNNVFDENYKMNEDELKAFGLSETEIAKFNQYKVSGIQLVDGKAFQNGQEIITMERGKFTWAVKAIRKGYNALPSKVKSFIAQYTGLNAFLGLIEHYTGALEDGIYKACIRVGMPSSVANFVTKTIMLFVF
ncbi:hypothetical protein ACN6J9_05905 [Carnobacterium maltaromaticum]|uniref:hypothetical protein n=1 Tax=Carnobacterium TaxID=2747 RepID=UPI00165AA517|nr:hypothetical protein [Carnobacterium maltaromaticum]MBC9808934.1 hypothetical protein [Carnobacterium maltaromaticum]MDW5523981.1 hypothetical protein [Carnobacterium maltaromaticum]